MLGAIAVVAAVVALVRGRTSGLDACVSELPALAVGLVTLAAMLVGTDHSHSHDEPEAVASGAGRAGAPPTATPTATATRPPPAGRPRLRPTGHGRTTRRNRSTSAASTASPPSSSCGRRRSSRTRCEELPAFADVDSLDELGYRSIGDARTGYEHFINYSLINDDVILDPTQPESLVFRVDGDQRTLVSAMFIVGQRAIDDPELVDYGGRLMQWHVHENLCWRGGDDGPQVAGVTDADGNCPEGTVHAGGDNPMVHVWIVAHECGPFAALEGHGAGQAAAADGARTDQCAHDDGHSHDSAPSAAQAGSTGGESAAAAPVPYDPSRPIDLSGTPGVTPEQQAFAENLVASTLRDLPQFADTADAEAAGFHSIGDGASGFEHYIHWDWIDDDVWLDPDHPESLVYRVEPDGSRTLVSAMFMLPNSMALDDVPDWGGALMQWHVHSDLCFDVSDPEAPRVGGLTDSAGAVHRPAHAARRVADDPRLDRRPTSAGRSPPSKASPPARSPPARSTSATTPTAAAAD